MANSPPPLQQCLSSASLLGYKDSCSEGFGDIVNREDGVKLCDTRINNMHRKRFLLEIGRQLKCPTKWFVTCVFFSCVFAVLDLIQDTCYHGRLLVRCELRHYISLVDAAGESDTFKTSFRDIKV